MDQVRYENLTLSSQEESWRTLTDKKSSSSIYQDILNQYKFPLRIMKETKMLLNQYPQFKVTSGLYVNRYKQESTLLYIAGELLLQEPISIEVWLPMEYPARPPKVVVKRRSERELKRNHEFMNGAGGLQHEYLKQWNPENQCILELLDICTQLFRIESPYRDAMRMKSDSRILKCVAKHDLVLI